jgi:glycosyltransferase involved in cell wall biosynthesis
MSASVLVNGRFLTMHATGVQRYARELLMHLPDQVDDEVLVAVPPQTLFDARDHDRIARIPTGRQWHGLPGHAWEQVVLPGLAHRAGRRAALLSPAQWGPVTVSRQVAVFQDIGPRLHPEYFPRGYRMMSETFTPLLVRRCARLGVSCRAVADDLCRHYGAEPGRVDVIPPGVGAPFDSWPVNDLESREGRYCVMVGAHDIRKNVSWVLGWWPSVYDELGIELVITTKGQVPARIPQAVLGSPGVIVRTDPDDEELARLYSGALCLLWPSLYEGFGLPLLEAMAVGTPFLATDTGAAAELAVEPGQVLPLDSRRWIDQLRLWSAQGVASLRQASAAAARSWSWAATAQAAAAALARISG